MDKDDGLGRRARAVFREYRLFAKPVYPPGRLLHLACIKPLLILGAIASMAWIVARPVQRATGRSVTRQVLDMVVLGFRDRVDALTYYLQELYRPEARAEAQQYLTRYETKNGLLAAINRRAGAPHLRRALGDKLLFGQICAAANLPSPETLAIADGGVVSLLGPRASLDRDLFIKPRRGKGAQGTSAFRRVGPERFRTADGRHVSLDQLLGLLSDSSQSRPFLVQPYLKSDPALADLAEQSIIVLRVITCINASGEPEVTHGVLRILGKLEPDWPVKYEFGAPIDLATGTLGLLAADKPWTCLQRYKTHPITGAAVAGRTVPGWAGIRDLALTAHRHFSSFVVVGWDIAMTASGPIILEGNKVMDVAFVQRVYDRPIGRTRLGELLNYHLDELCRVLERKRRVRRRDVGRWVTSPMSRFGFAAGSALASAAVLLLIGFGGVHRSAQFGLETAIREAEAITGGVAFEAREKSTPGEDVYFVDLAEGGSLLPRLTTVQVSARARAKKSSWSPDAESEQQEAEEAGRVQRARVSLQQAVAIAQRRVGGRAIASELDEKDSAAYDIDVVSSGAPQEVRIDINSGRVVAVLDNDDNIGQF